jgi:hypothetical protein
MIGSIKNHPFPVEAYFNSSLVLGFAVPKHELESMIPNCLELDMFNDEYGFVAAAMVQTTGLRPKGFPAMLGRDFFLIGYRIFVRYRNQRNKRLRGLYILKSETDKKSMELLGNIFTKYSYSTTDIQTSSTSNEQTIYSEQSGFKVVIDRSDREPILPMGSPFSSFEEARRFSGPLPFTFTFNESKSEMLIVEGVRSNWKPKPLNLLSSKFSFIESLNLKGLTLANVFEVTNVPYYWKRGVIESVSR